MAVFAAIGGVIAAWAAACGLGYACAAGAGAAWPTIVLFLLFAAALVLAGVRERRLLRQERELAALRARVESGATKSEVSDQLTIEAELRRQALMLRSIVDHLPQGVSVFDDQLRLKVWNSVLLDVLELPPEAVYADVPFEALILFPARRGEYGPGDPAEQVRARRELALKFEPHRFERTRMGPAPGLPDGPGMAPGGACRRACGGQSFGAAVEESESGRPDRVGSR